MRISGVNISEKKQLQIALTDVYGIGKHKAIDILDKAKVNIYSKVKDLNTEQETLIRKLVEENIIEGDLRRVVAANIKRLKETKSLRGYFHNVGLPTRGQRTKTNARTRKGPKKTMGSGRVKLQKK